MLDCYDKYFHKNICQPFLQHYISRQHFNSQRQHRFEQFKNEADNLGFQFLNFKIKRQAKVIETDIKQALLPFSWNQILSELLSQTKTQESWAGSPLIDILFSSNSFTFQFRITTHFMGCCEKLSGY